jgi:hypothetical protein
MNNTGSSRTTINPRAEGNPTITVDIEQGTIDG